VFVFFFSRRRRHTICLSDWSSDVCSSDLVIGANLIFTLVKLLAPFTSVKITLAPITPSISVALTTCQVIDVPSCVRPVAVPSIEIGRGSGRGRVDSPRVAEYAEQKQCDRR